MDTLLTSEIRTARKNYRCMAWDWVMDFSGDIKDVVDFFDLSQDESETLKKVAATQGLIEKGDKYLYQTGIQNGEFVTFRAIPEVNKICCDHGLYPDY